jgi:hypothetical protein
MIGGILAMPQFLSYFNYPSNFTQGGITASIQAGAFAGSLVGNRAYTVATRERICQTEAYLSGSLIQGDL